MSDILSSIKENISHTSIDKVGQFFGDFLWKNPEHKIMVSNLCSSLPDLVCRQQQDRKLTNSNNKSTTV